MKEPLKYSSLLDVPMLHIAIIILLGLIAYSNSFGVPFVFDDAQNIVGNPIIKDLNHFIYPSTAEGYQEYPLFKSRYVGFLSFALDFRAHGLDVWGYHATNLAIHVLNALLLYWLVVLTFRTPFLLESDSARHTNTVALFSAFLFVAHPVQTQAVTYIVQRFASLATLFYILSLALYIKSRLSESMTAKSSALYVLAIISAILAMKTKETAFTLPVTVALYELFFFRGSLKRRFIYLLPLLLTMLIIPLSLIDADRPVGEMIGGVGEAARLESDLPRADYLFTQFGVIATYLRLLFLPINQNLDYDYPVFHSLLAPRVFLSFLLLLSFFGAGVYMTYRSRKKDAALRVVAFGIFWFFITMSVESSIIPIKDVIFEHRLYLPDAALFLLAGAVISPFLKRNRVEKHNTLLTLMALVLVLTMASATYVRNGVWDNKLSLWQDVVQKSPMNTRAHNNLGIAFKGDGNIDEAIKQYKLAIKLDPAYANAYSNLGNIYLDGGLYDLAIEQYTTALLIRPYHPDANYNLALAYHYKGITNEAIRFYEKALNINPYDVEAHYNLGLAYLAKNEIEPARLEFEKTLQLDPGYKSALEQLNAIKVNKSPLK